MEKEMVEIDTKIKKEGHKRLAFIAISLIIVLIILLNVVNYFVS